MRAVVGPTGKAKTVERHRARGAREAGQARRGIRRVLRHRRVAHGTGVRTRDVTACPESYFEGWAAYRGTVAMDGTLGHTGVDELI